MPHFDESLGAQDRERSADRLASQAELVVKIFLGRHAASRREFAAANAVVPRRDPQRASEMAGQGDVVILDVRDAPELAASGKIKGAVHVPRGLLEFRADPELPSHDPALQPDIVPKTPDR